MPRIRWDSGFLGNEKPMAPLGCREFDDFDINPPCQVPFMGRLDSAAAAGGGGGLIKSYGWVLRHCAAIGSLSGSLLSSAVH
ncbi:unnamed protein product [Spirodela intermedia]|uniref:Uncharacterized protein n=1 Tax=Spirodela intermedia TaxID=51605 RepID=A0A7I8KZE3_SPIIN|nr:unnamed protein product [Spirodela intermedia]